MRCASLVGTEEYIAPETVRGNNPSYATDLWSLGIILYQFLTGSTPFKGFNQAQTFHNILTQDSFDFPDSIPDDAQDLITRLLIKDSSLRLGA